MSLSVMKIQASRTGAIQTITFNMKLLNKSNPELAERIKELADIALAEKHKNEPTKPWSEVRKQLNRKHKFKD